MTERLVLSSTKHRIGECATPRSREIVVVTYYGCDREPIRTAVQHLSDQHAWIVHDCPLYKWRLDVENRRTNYLDDAAETFNQPNIEFVLFWYHSLTLPEWSYLRAHTRAEVKFMLYTWDDPYDWFSPFLNTREAQHVFSDGGVLTCCKDCCPRYAEETENDGNIPMYSVPCCFAPPGFVERFADDAVLELNGPDRFVCDVCIMCTNLYDDKRLYAKQLIQRKALIDALYHNDRIILHIYGPETFRDHYPSAYRGFAQFEDTYRLMRTARVCISTHVVSMNVHQYINERTIIAMGCGALLLTDIVPPHSCAIYLGDTLEQAISTVLYAVQMPYVEAEGIRNKLRTFARQRYTWKCWAKTTSDFLLARAFPAALNSANAKSIWLATIQNLAMGESDTVATCDDETKTQCFSEAISIGSWCIGAWQLKRLGLRDRTYPFDWLFSNLEAVIQSVRPRRSHLVVDEFLTPPQYRTVFPNVDRQQQLEFPHHAVDNLDDLFKLRRACERWQEVLHDVKEERRSILLCHTARPAETAKTVLQNLFRLSQDIKKHCRSNLHVHVVSVWYQVVPERQGLQSVDCILRNADVSVFLARVPHEWDGEHWVGENEIWDQIFAHFQITK